MTELFAFITNIQPLGVIGLLALVIYLQVKNQQGTKRIASNHLHGLPEMEKTLARVEATLNEIAKDISYMRGRMNGKDR